MSAPTHTRNAIGAGLLALDLILNNKEVVPARTNMVAGGSCGNVLAILAYIGWNAYPVAQLGDNTATTILCQDLARWGVKTDFITKSAQGVTPLIIHRIFSDKRQHKFEFRNPQTQEWLPRFRPITKKYVHGLPANFPEAAVFYFDRATPGNLLLAEQSSAAGALVVFEPSNSSDKKLFERALVLAHVVKFSQQRLPNYPDSYPVNQALVEIQTKGEAGIMYRMQTTGPAWTSVPAFFLEATVDTAGAGDWCTAGIIDQLLAQHQSGFDGLSSAEVEHAIGVGQAYGAINCCFTGARGTMYNLSNKEFKQTATRLCQAPDSALLNTINGSSQPASLAIADTPVHIGYYELLRN